MIKNETYHIIIAIILLTLIASIEKIIKNQLNLVPIIFTFAVIIIGSQILIKKLSAYFLDSDIEHEIWEMKNFGLTPRFKLKKSIPTGIIFPILISIIFLGMVQFSAFLTYEVRALKYRASKRFGFYSYKEVTDWHNGLIGASGIFIVLIISFISYLIPYSNFEILTKMSAYYALSNLIPISKLDGTQIFFGSKIIWMLLITIAGIFSFVASTII